LSFKVTSRASNIEYAIRDVIVHTKQLIKDGKKIYYLNIGDPAAFDLTVPPHVKAALCKLCKKTTITTRLRKGFWSSEKPLRRKKNESTTLT